MFLTFQKIIPVIIIFFFNLIGINLYIYILFILICCYIGSVGGFIQVSLRKIIIYSSIAQISLLFRSLLISKFIWLNYFVLYSLILISIIFVLDSDYKYYIIDLISSRRLIYSVIVILIFISLRGLPPFRGFIIKVYLLYLITDYYFWFIIFILIMSFVSLFYYLRVGLKRFWGFMLSKSFYKNKKIRYIVVFFNLWGLWFVIYIYI